MTALSAAFLGQEKACAAFGSPFMARLMRLLAEHWPMRTPLAQRFADWPGDVSAMGASLPLRLADGLHALVLQGRDPGLMAAYPPHIVPHDSLLQAVLAAMRQHAAFLCDWVENARQTNEVRRGAVLNLMFERFRLDIGDRTIGPISQTA